MDDNLAETPADAELAHVEVSTPDGSETEAQGGESAPPTANDSTPEPAKRDKIQERFDSLTREKYEALRERDLERMQRERLAADLEALNAQAKPYPVAPDNRPTLEQFGYDEAKYAEGLLAWAEGKILPKAEELVTRKLTEREQKQLQDATISKFREREAAFVKDHPDYLDKVNSGPVLPTDTQQVLIGMENGPQIIHALYEKREVAEAIAKLPPSLQLVEIGGIAARLEVAKAKPVVSQAPPPPSKIDAAEAHASVSTTDASGDRLSDDEWIALERKRLARKAQRK